MNRKLTSPPTPELANATSWRGHGWDSRWNRKCKLMGTTVKWGHGNTALHVQQRKNDWAMRVALTNDIYVHCHFYFHRSLSSLNNSENILSTRWAAFHQHIWCYAGNITDSQKRSGDERPSWSSSLVDVSKSNIWRELGVMCIGCHVGPTHGDEILSADAISNHWQWTGWTMMYDYCMLFT